MNDEEIDWNDWKKDAHARFLLRIERVRNKLPYFTPEEELRYEAEDAEEEVKIIKVPRRIINIDTMETYDSIKELSEDTKIPVPTLRKVLNSEKNTSYLHWI